MMKISPVKLSIKNQKDEIDIPFSLVYNVLIRNRLDRIGTTIDLIINDETDIKNKLPIKSGEELTISMDDYHGNSMEKVFVVINTKTLTTNDGDNSMLSIKGMTKDSFKLFYTKGYESYNDVLISDVVNNEMKKIGALNVEVEETKEIMNVINSGKTQYQFIESLTNRALNKLGKIGYLFFEDLEGIKFKSLETIIDSEKENINDYVFGDFNKEYRYNIIDWMEVARNNYMNDQISNIMNNEFIQYNPDKKKIEKVEVKFDDIENFSKLDKGTIYNKETKDTTDKRTTIMPYYGTDVTQKTALNDVMFKSYSRKMHLLMNGDFNLQVGQIMNLVYADKFNTSNLNNEIAGKWLVTRVLYQFNQDNFKIKVEVAKNSVYDYEEKNTSGVVVSS